MTGPEQVSCPRCDGTGQIAATVRSTPVIHFPRLGGPDRCSACGVLWFTRDEGRFSTDPEVVTCGLCRKNYRPKAMHREGTP